MNTLKLHNSFFLLFPVFKIFDTNKKSSNNKLKVIVTAFLIYPLDLVCAPTEHSY